MKQGGRIAIQLPAKDFCPEFFKYINDAIAQLCIEGFYTNWESPWYFSTKEEYETILCNVGFRNIKVFNRNYSSVFESINEVLKWLEPAGLRPYLELLPEKEQEYFKYTVAMSFENNRTDRGIEINFRRLFVFAEKQ